MELKQEELEAYNFVDKIKPRADGFHGLAPWWYGWALREAFEAGFNYHKKISNQSLQGTGGTSAKSKVSED